MFAIALQQRQYKTYILSDQVAGSRLEVVPERGGIITRWQVQNREVLYLDEERFANPALTVRGGIPILFPICGNLPNNAYTYQGQTYTLKQHGFARDLPWQVLDRVTQGRAAITLSLESDDFTRSIYPFEFKLAFTYTLKGNELEIVQKYTNCSSSPMPFSMGFHPYFNVTDKSQLKFLIPATDLMDQQTQDFHSFDGTFNFQKDEIDVAFPNLTALSATVSEGDNMDINLEYDTNYSALVFWTIKGKPFYCLEPWSALRNALNTGDRLLQLEPNTSLTATIRLTAIVS